jgi:hypothetical protein
MTTDAKPRRGVMVVALVAGWAVMGFGAWSAAGDAADARPMALAVHIGAFALAHDLVVAPLFLAVGWLTTRLLPSVMRGPMAASLAATTVLVVFSIPLVRRWGERPSNPSALPQSYGRNVVVLLAVVWVVGFAVSGVRAWRSRSAAGDS